MALPDPLPDGLRPRRSAVPPRNPEGPAPGRRVSPPPEADLPWVALPQDPEPDAAPAAESAAPRPDRSRISALSLDRDEAYDLNTAYQAGQRTVIRTHRGAKTDRWLAPLGLLVVLVLGALALWWMLRGEPVLDRVVVDPASLPVPTAATPAEAALQAVESFLAEPTPEGRAKWILEPGRVLPLLRQPTPEGSVAANPDTVFPGVPQPWAAGITLVPVRVEGPPAQVFHAVVRDTPEGARLDWETFDQELHRKFQAFATDPESPSAVFRLVLERAHLFGPAAANQRMGVRVSNPGSPPAAEPIAAVNQAEQQVSNGLPWNTRRRALVKLSWSRPAQSAPRMVVEEILRWEFIP